MDTYYLLKIVPLEKKGTKHKKRTKPYLIVQCDRKEIGNYFLLVNDPGRKISKNHYWAPERISCSRFLSAKFTICIYHPLKSLWYFCLNYNSATTKWWLQQILFFQTFHRFCSLSLTTDFLSFFFNHTVQSKLIADPST